MNRRTPYLALVACTAVGFCFTLMLYALVFGGNPFYRLGYVTLVSVGPAIAALVLISLSGLPPWRSVVIAAYAALFVLGMLVQAAARLII